MTILSVLPGILVSCCVLLDSLQDDVRQVGQEPAPSKCVLMSTSRAVRSDMRCWVVTDEGDRWLGKLDVRDLGGHLDTTFRGWSATLAKRVRLVIARLVLVFFLHTGFSW